MLSSRLCFKSMIFSVLVSCFSAYACDDSSLKYLQSSFSQTVASLNLSSEAQSAECLELLLHKRSLLNKGEPERKHVSIDLDNANDLHDKLEVLHRYHNLISIYDLSLSYNQSVQWIELLPSLLAQEQHLVTLNLSHNKLHEVDRKVLQKLLRNTHKISRLNLSANGLGDHFFDDELFSEGQMAELDLSYNPLGDVGVRKLLLQLNSRHGKGPLKLKLNFIKASSPSLLLLSAYARQHSEVTIEFKGNFYDDNLLDEIPFNLLLR